MKKAKLRELGKIYSSVAVEKVEKPVEKTEKPKKTRKKKEV